MYTIHVYLMLLLLNVNVCIIEIHMYDVIIENTGNLLYLY